MNYQLLSTIGKNIKKYRLEMGMTQKEFADLTNLSINYIGSIERGEKIPSLIAFIEIINSLNVSADMILCEVVTKAYSIKESQLSKQIGELSNSDQRKIYAIIETLANFK